MIYLITQMLLCIALALITGAAVGWLVHRARYADRITALRHTIGQQHAQVQQARTDVAMITQDFDELKARAQSEIDMLRQDNKRLPSLDQNLEKSQLLVRQLMQKHEAQLRDLTQENEQLGIKLSVMQDREAAFAKVRAELESTRSRLADLQTGGASEGLTAAASSAQAGGPPSSARNVAADRDHSVATQAAPPFVPQEASVTRSDADAATDDAPRKAVRSSWASAPAPDLDENKAESADTALAEPDGRSQTAAANVEPAETQHETVSDSAALMHSMGLDVVDNEDETADDYIAHPKPAARESAGDPGSDLGSDLGPGASASETVEAPGTPEHDPLAIGEVEFDENSSEDFNDDTLTEFDPDVEQLFDTVDHHDDLKQIFGIGPVTEKALNELGITSYSQLADLQRHDIETIADALQIFPGRIERDDWVGNARRQLEDVLEEL